MPKIIIREIDNTAAVGTEYENFAVVVPGVGKFKENGAIIEDPYSLVDGYDENGVCLLRTLSDFEKYAQNPDGPQMIKSNTETDPPVYVNVEKLLLTKTSKTFKADLVGNRIAKNYYN